MDDGPVPLERYGFTPAVADRFSALGAADGAVPGRVVKAGRSGCVAATSAGLLEAALAPMLDQTPATGDWVAVQPDGDPPLVVAIAERTTALTRRDPSQREGQVLAANVDVVFLVHGLDRPLRPGRIERALVLAWDSGASPVIVLTKADLVQDASSVAEEVAVVAPDVPVHTTRSDDRGTIDHLRTYLRGPEHAGVEACLTAAVLGESGAGKSTLVNALAGADVQETGAVRSGDHKGRHTTTSRELVPVPGGGVLLDTPGVRELGLWVAEEGLERVYAEIVELAFDCRFTDCTHGDEPGCAVAAAVERGDVDPRRLARVHALLDELAEAEDRRLAKQRRGRGRPPPRRSGR